MPVSLYIDDVAFGGRGVGRRGDGRAVFVPFVLTGETVRVEIIREHRHYAEADLLSVETASPHRVTPRCPYFTRCGGCSYQHIAAAEQLVLKERQVAQVLRRVGHLADPPLRPIIPSPEMYAYRNRITVHAAGGRAGYFTHGPGERELLDITHCPIASPSVNSALGALRQNLARHTDHIEARSARHFTLRASESEPRFFSQTNDGAAARLLNLVRDLANDEPSPRVHLIDAYCAAGAFAKALRGTFANVTGIEWDRHAVAAARHEAANHETYLAGDVAGHLPAVLSAAPSAETLLIADPPAEGLARPVVDAVLTHTPAVMIYISCHPATLARDLALLLRADASPSYELASVTPLDMFPQTAEIEVVAHLKLRR